MNSNQLSAFWDIGFRLIAPLVGASVGGFIAWLSGRNVLSRSLIEQSRSSQSQLLRTKSEELYSLILKFLHDVQYFLSMTRSPQPPETVALDIFLGLEVQLNQIRMYYHRYFKDSKGQGIDVMPILERIATLTTQFVESAKQIHDSIANIFRDYPNIRVAFNSIYSEITHSTPEIQAALRRLAELDL